MPVSFRSSQKNSSLSYNPLEARQLLAGDVCIAPTTQYYLEDGRQESVARDYLANNHATADVFEGASDLRLTEIKHGLATTVTRFQQTIDGLPVADAYVATIQNSTGDFTLVHDQSFDGATNEFNAKTAIDFAASENIALDYAGANRTFADSRGELAWLPGDNGTADQVWQITVFGVTPDSTHGDFLTYIDAESGKVISQENRIANFTDGEGEVYYPHPYQSLGDGSTIADNNDADSTALTNERINVVLQGLDEGTGLLTGEFVDLATLNSTELPDVDANETSRVYDYTRDDDRFEQVNIYHTVDQINRYFHTLGFDDDTGTPNGIRDFPTLANAHWYDQDQSFYSSGDDGIHFGDGGVDDGEDGDIIAHEYGHAIQNNQNAAWGGGEMGAMGEGYGDYLAASFFETHGDATFQASHAAAVGEWDATSYSNDDPPNLRRVDGNKMYPVDLVGQVHADGEIWSRALWDLNHLIGADVADQLILESHFMLPANATMVTAAEMILEADQNINGGANDAAIRQAFEDRGILEPPATIGTISLDNSVYAPGDVVTITVEDGNGPASVDVILTSSNGDSETLTIDGTTTYTTTIASVAGTAVADDGQLQAAIGDSFTVTYEDTDDGTGSPITATDMATFANVTQIDSTDTPIPITDNNTITSTITVTNTGTLLDVDVLLDITHTWNFDLSATLTGPNGTVIDLFERQGGNSDNYTETRFDDDAVDPISSGTAPYTGSFQPVGELSTYNGIVAAGDWTLSITDSAGADQGTLNFWSLFIVVEEDDSVSPVIDSDPATNEIVEDAPIGSTVGLTALATDPDDGDTVTYSLTDDAGGLFAIDADTGVVTTAGDLDFDVMTSHTIEVLATSTDTSTSMAMFTIQVLDDSIGPVTDADGAANEAQENVPVGTPVGVTALATDAGDTVTYSLTDDAGGLFEIDADTGVVITAGTLDFETMTSHTIEVLATSSDTSTSTAQFTIQVIDVDDTGMGPVGPIIDINPNDNTVPEDAPLGTPVGLTALANDPDDTVTYSLIDDAGGLFEIDTNTGVVTVAGQLDYETATSHTIVVLAASGDFSTISEMFEIFVTDVDDDVDSPVISSRQIVYSGSAYGGADAIAPDKTFLRAGETATFANYSSYSRGINGLMLEVNNFNIAPTLDNIDSIFDFKVGGDDTTADWDAAPAPIGVSFVSDVNANGTDQILVTWADNAIENEWLQITVLANAETGLATPDVFYFGNVIGETGNEAANARVNVLDIAGTRLNQTGFGTAEVGNVYDFNRDQRVNVLDVAISRLNQSGFSVVNLITPDGQTKGDVANLAASKFEYVPGVDSNSNLTSKADKLDLTQRISAVSEKTLDLAGSQNVRFQTKPVDQTTTRSETSQQTQVDDVFGEFDFLDVK